MAEELSPLETELADQSPNPNQRRTAVTDDYPASPGTPASFSSQPLLRSSPTRAGDRYNHLNHDDDDGTNADYPVGRKNYFSEQASPLYDAGSRTRMSSSRTPSALFNSRLLSHPSFDQLPDTEYTTNSGSPPRLAFHRSPAIIWWAVKQRASSVLLYVRGPTFTRSFKCALAYFLASLVVFSSHISSIYGVSDGKHLAATASVYFHAARSVGSMIEATIYAEIALLYSAALSSCSMLVSNLFFKLDMISVGHFIVLVVFCAGGLGSIAYMKQRMNRPTFNTASSLASVSFATILIREGSIQRGSVSFLRMIQVSAIVNGGIIIAVCVCLLLFPVTAISQVKSSINYTLSRYEEMLQLITAGFTSDNPLRMKNYEIPLKEVQAAHRSLDAAIHEARFEFYMWGTVDEFKHLKRLTHSVEDILSRLGGIRSSHMMKLQLMNVEPGYRKNSCAELFNVFNHYCGDQMARVTGKFCATLEGMKFNGTGRHSTINLPEDQKARLLEAKDEFVAARLSALHDIYAMDLFRTQVQTNHAEIGAYLEEVVAICGQFSYGLLTLTDCLIESISIIEDYSAYLAQCPEPSWAWLRFWELSPAESPESGSQATVAHLPPSFFRLFTDEEVRISSASTNDPFRLRLWRSLYTLRRIDVLYGIKVGLGAMLFTLPAYIQKTRPWFSFYRMEWGLVSFVIVMNVSIGGTLSAAFYRILGTCLGTLLAYIAWQLAPGNAAVLPFVGFCIALGCFHIILTGKPNAVFGRFILLTFNLTALYSFSISRDDFDNDDDDDDEGGLTPIVGEIAWHRLFSVTLGVIWGVLVTLYIARADLKRKLGTLWIQMGLLWKGDPLRNMALGRDSAPEVAKYMGLGQEILLSKSLLKLNPLLSQASKEFRLKGAFPKSEYKSIIISTQGILDSFHMMNDMLLRQSEAAASGMRIISYTEYERRELNNRLFLLFYLISSSLRLGLPLPQHLPNTEHARELMISKVNEFRHLQISQEATIREDEFILVYSYILATLAINAELLNIINKLQCIYGVITDEASLIV
ncbi:Fusaric acid resistance protein-like-domain-containing protein [Myxozyma melibiosi]|uniref:Fusaric acid resistance protein-like-domain-containing protein n=1 Tax=Myxozyma melibiosi TaxID=54550 RepID=A0ABR1F0S4_9ASCO